MQITLWISSFIQSPSLLLYPHHCMCSTQNVFRVGSFLQKKHKGNCYWNSPRPKAFKIPLAQTFRDFCLYQFVNIFKPLFEKYFSRIVFFLYDNYFKLEKNFNTVWPQWIILFKVSVNSFLGWTQFCNFDEKQMSHLHRSRELRCILDVKKMMNLVC